MPVEHNIIRNQKFAYVKAWGNVSVADILSDGSRMFAEPEWQNGFNILCDYRDISEFSLDSADIDIIVNQDKNHDSLLSKSRCAVVSVETKLTSMVFRHIDDAIGWLGLDAVTFELINKSMTKIDNT